MTTVLEDNVHNFAVDGSSDDLDVPIKAVFADLDYTARYTVHGLVSRKVHGAQASFKESSQTLSLRPLYLKTPNTDMEFVK